MANEMCVWLILQRKVFNPSLNKGCRDAQLNKSKLEIRSFIYFKVVVSGIWRSPFSSHFKATKRAKLNLLSRLLSPYRNLALPFLAYLLRITRTIFYPFP